MSSASGKNQQTPTSASNKGPQGNPNPDDGGRFDSPELPQNVYIVRWPISMPEFETVKEAGAKVKVTEFVETTTVKTPAGEKIDVSYLVKTDSGKLLPIAYLQPKSEFDLRCDLEGEIADSFGYNDHELGLGGWWSGRVTPCVAAGKFIEVSNYQGEYAVCQPPEWEVEGGKEWAPYCLLVRTFTGEDKQMIEEWKEDEYFNLVDGKELQVERPDVHRDILPFPPSGPFPPVLIFTIKRSENGDFFLENSVEFNSLEKLMDHYYTHPLPLKEPPGKKNKTNLVLRKPAEMNNTPFSSPRPMLYPMKCPGYKHAPFKLVLEKKEGTLMSFTPWKMRFPLLEQIEGEKEKGKKTKDEPYKAMMVLNGAYNSVVIRNLTWNFNRKAFEKDLTRIHHADGSTYAHAHKEIIKADLKSTKFRSGSNFISHIVTYSDKSEEWIAYEAVPGMPLDKVLMRRRYNDDMWTSPRAKLEIAYQIAGAMRFLEQNFLCHRHLRCSNVVVYQNHLSHIAIKVTDYMVPYSFLDTEFVEELNLGELENYPWWAPECIRYRCFDIISDVWAFGCVLFELQNNGKAPYCFEETPPMGAKAMQTLLLANTKMKTQEGDELDTYIDDMIGRCMRYEYKERPTFDHMFRFLRQLLYDPTISPEKTIEAFLTNAPRTFEHKWSRGKMKDYASKA